MPSVCRLSDHQLDIYSRAVLKLLLRTGVDRRVIKGCLYPIGPGRDRVEVFQRLCRLAEQTRLWDLGR